MCADRAAGAGRRRVWFLTGTRADFGKLKPLIFAAAATEGVDVTVLATGMHLLDRYGRTVIEVRRLPPPIEVLELPNQVEGATLDEVLATTVEVLGRAVRRDPPDLLVVHGDRVEALAGASVGSLCGVPVAHVEGGERSGTVDGTLRHAISKLSHLHLVANDEAARRVLQLGEDPAAVRIIGSPDIDVMLSDDLPGIHEVRAAYEIAFDRYAVVLFHAVAGESAEQAGDQADALLDALAEVELDAVVIYPNNDPGSRAILDAYERRREDPRLAIFPSIRFEAFLTLMHHAVVVVGNSSAGIREAPVYGVPSINIGTRQRDRFHHPTIRSCAGDRRAIVEALREAMAQGHSAASDHFGAGEAGQRFAQLLAEPATWSLELEKRFLDVDSGRGER
jgi:UDP-N-acetylglucosamine 2-epimerase (hydrolysing)